MNNFHAMESQNKSNRLYQNQNGTVPGLPTIAQNYDFKTEKPRMTRVILESLEVALLMCNLFFDHYGLAKLFNIFNQILPTAYTLNTGYWVFYSSQDGYSICVCSRFGLRCPHQRSGFHWIDIDAMKVAEDNYLFSAQSGKMFPINFTVHIDPIINDVLRAYDINIILNVQPFDLQRNKFIPINDEITTLLIDARYILTPSYWPLQSSLVEFNPHPMSHPHYSRYFEFLRRLNVFYSSAPLQSHVARTHTIICGGIPNFSVMTNNSLTSNYRPTPKMNLPTWSGPFATFHGHFNEVRPSTTHIKQEYFNINYINNAMVPPPYPPPPYTAVAPAYQHLPSGPQFPPHCPTPGYQNHTNKRQYAEQPRSVQFPLPDNAAMKQKKRVKPAVIPVKQTTEPHKLLPTMLQYPPAYHTNHPYQAPSPRQPPVPSTTNTQFSPLHDVAIQKQAKFNPAIRNPVHHDPPKPPERNFLNGDYCNNFPALPASKDFKKKPKPRSMLPSSTTQMTGTTFDFDNLNLGHPSDPVLSSTIQNLKSQIEAQSGVSVPYDTEASQMVQQTSDVNIDALDDMDPTELINLVTDVIRVEIAKDLPFIKPEEFDNFQRAHSSIEVSDNSFGESPSPDDDCLYIAE